MNIKERIVALLGGFGVILFYILKIIICCLPFIMIGPGFIGALLMFAAETVFPISTIVFWVWGLIKAIAGVQDFWAILYYISFTILFLPFFISTAIDFVKSISRRY